jgi:TonB-dependent SusC/RagA subfamily outer membrane receptor
MLQGAIPGVQINQGSGEPGNEGVSIRIRGKGTFSGAGSDPLVLIDGVQGKFSDVNPNDIENVSVLKDAASAAIYGSRAANGVILITTKQGNPEKQPSSMTEM